MNFNGFGNIEDLLRACGYTNSSSDYSSNSSNCDSDSNCNCNNNSNSNNNGNSNTDTYGCSDIPNGFQTIPPEVVAIIGELLGNIIAGNIPFNLQNVIGNWFELVGQVILVFNAQQQYFQSGPGRYYDLKNYNVTNPFCSSNPASPKANTTNNTSNTSNSSSSSSKNNNVNANRLEELEKQVQALTKELNEIKIFLQEK